MIVYHDYKELENVHCKKNGRVVSIGNFDGVHLGHRAVIALGLEQAQHNGLDYAICTFNPHPLTLFKPEEPVFNLTVPQDKFRLMDQFGVETVLAQRFDQAFSELTHVMFAEKVLAGALRAKLVIVGENFRYGRDRDGDVDVLTELGKKFGYQVTAQPLITLGDMSISSSRIRQLLAQGEVETAGDLLGRYHQIPGVVIKGKGVGRNMGFPTVNIEKSDVLLPPSGIYAGLCELEDGRLINAAVYIGDRPTLGHGRSIEAHLLDFNLDLYNAKINIHFVSRIRPDTKFDSVDALCKQIQLDIDEVRRRLETLNVRQ